MDKLISTGIIQNPPSTTTETIPAGGVRDIFYAHNYFRVTEGTYNLGDLEFRFSETGQPAKLLSGQAVELAEVVNRVTIRNTTGADITITVNLGIGKIYDDRLSVSGTLRSIKPPTSIESYDDVTLTAATATQILGVDNDRIEAFISNVSGADIRIGDNNVATARGALLKNNQSMVIETTSDIYGYSVGGGDVAVIATVT